MKLTSSSGGRTHQRGTVDPNVRSHSTSRASAVRTASQSRPAVQQRQAPAGYRDAYSRVMNNPDLPKVVHDSYGRDSNGSYTMANRPVTPAYDDEYIIEGEHVIEVKPILEDEHILEGEHFENTQPVRKVQYEQPVYAYERASGKSHAKSKPEKKKKRFKGLKITGCIVAGLVALYLFGVYTSIPFIANLRTLYVETAMMTMNHQWLATALLPKSVIDEFRNNMDGYEVLQDNVESNWDNYGTISYTKLPSFTNDTDDPDDIVDPDNPDEIDDEPVEPEISFWQDPESEFYQIYYEIDFDTFSAYAETHQDTMFDENGNLFIDEADVGSKGTGIMTTNGDPVLSIDTVNGIIIVRLSGLEYNGVLAIAKDPTMVGIEVAERLGVVGSKVAKIAEAADAVIAINASGFEDPDGGGNGGIVHGLLYKNGEKIKGTAGGNYKAIYFDSNYRLNVTSYSSKLDIYNGIEFKPALVVNGEAAVTGSFGWGIQPRTAIGQTEDGSVLMIVINGRSTSSIGITVGDLAQLFLDYGAVQAGNLDGGSSSVMYYNGRLITSPCGGDKVNGRYLPDAFAVYRRSSMEPAEPEVTDEE